MHRTKIDWADSTWNPVWGCRGSCAYCYARKVARRFGLQVAGRDDFAPTWIERNFRRAFPRRPARIFVNSMSDVADWEPAWLGAVLARICEQPKHAFLFLTKRPAAAYLLGRREIKWPRNCWLGVTATSTDELRASEVLLCYLPTVRFISIEPVLEPIEARHIHQTVDWIIVGAETGNRRDRVLPELGWLREIYDYCHQVEIPLFFKGSLRHLWPADAYFPQEYPVGRKEL